MRLWLLLCVSVLWDTASLHPTRESNNAQLTECCPCPKDAFGRSVTPAYEAANLAAAGSSSDSVRAGVCPCQRDADSMGASSMFYPEARAERPFVSLEDPEENPDPILHPEVNLASSVLETLRQATDEEYRDALARDAERSAIPIASDEIAAESNRNLVTVVVNPKEAISDEDPIGEASHAHESRCIHPLGRSSLRSQTFKPSLRLTDILNLPRKQSWNLFDMDSGVGASNVNERVVEPSFNENEVKSNIPSVLSFSTKNKPASSFTLNENRESSGTEVPKLTDLVKPRKLEISNLSKLIPRLNTPNLLLQKDNSELSSTDVNMDSQNAPSMIQERFTGFEKNNARANDIKSTLFKGKNDLTVTTRPLKFNSPTINITPPKGRNAATDFLNGILKGLEIPSLNSLTPSDLFRLRNNNKASVSIEQKEKEVSPNDKSFTTEILDAVPSPSEIKSDHVSFEEVEREGGLNNNLNADEISAQKAIDENPMKTEIIDSVPNSSDGKVLLENNSHNTLGVGCDVKHLSTDGSTDATNNEKLDTFTKEENSDLINDMEQINDDSNDEALDDSTNIARDLENNAENVNSVEDSETDSSNNIMFNVDLSQTELDNAEVIEVITDSPVLENVDESNDNDNSLIENRVTDPLTPLRERIRNTLESLKKPPKKAYTNSKLEEFDESEEIITEQSTFNNENGKSAKMNLDVTANESNVEIDDLQQMSDSLLDKEIKRNESKLVKNETGLIQSIRPDIEGEVSSIVDLQDEDLENESNEADGFRISDNTIEENNLNPASVSNVSNDACLVKDPSTSKVITSEIDADNNEMKFEASEPVLSAIKPHTKLQSTLRQAILQPTSLSDLALPTLDVKEVFNLNPLYKPNMFNERKDVNDLSSTDDDDVDDMSTKQELMSPSTSSFRSALPPLQPLEDINLDILQLKPLTSGMPTLPRLNLNSFKSRLALPESMQLKPVILESSLGSKKGVVGATISLGKNNNGIKNSNMLQQASLKRPNILGRPLGSLPSLDDFRDTMLENAQNLLSTPLETTSRNAVEDTLRSGQVLTENLRVEAENAVKNLQKNIKSNFKEVSLGNQGLLLGSSMRSPKDLLDEISRSHDDVNDKLKGMQHDFNDRIESLRSNVLDEYRIPSLGSSIDFNDKLKGIQTDFNDRIETLRNNIFDEYRMPSLGSSIFDVPSLGSPMFRQSSLLKTKNKPSSSNKRKGKVVLGSNSDTKRRYTSARASQNKNDFKMPTASSLAITKTVESPKRRIESPVLKSLHKDSTFRKPSVFPREKPSLGLLSKMNSKTSNLPKFTKSKVKISFSTTTPQPSLPKRPLPRLNELTRTKPTTIKNSLSLPKSTSRDRIGSKLKSLRDSNAFPSEYVPIKVMPPALETKTIQDSSTKSIPKVIMDSQSNNALSVSTTIRPLTLSITRPKPVSKFIPKTAFDIGRGSSGTTEKVKDAPFRSQFSKLTPLAWPKSVDTEFLAKVRGALSARLAGLGQGLKPSANSRLSELLNTNNVKAVGNLPADMERSASDNVAVAVSGPEALKENTSYSCKMMCNKITT